MWIYIVIAGILLYALYKEREALGCSKFINGEDCDNANGKAVKGSNPSTSDTTSEILNKIDYAADYQSRFVKWRAVLIVSFVSMVILWFVLFRRFPNEWEIVTGTLVLFIFMTSAVGFYRFHLYDHVEHNINDATNILRDRLHTTV